MVIAPYWDSEKVCAEVMLFFKLFSNNMPVAWNESGEQSCLWSEHCITGCTKSLQERAAFLEIRKNVAPALEQNRQKSS